MTCRVLATTPIDSGAAEWMRIGLLQVIYTIRSERQPVEQPDFNLLFSWFIALSMVEHVWDQRQHHRWVHCAVSALFHQPEDPQADKGGLSLPEDCWRSAQDQADWPDMLSVQPLLGFSVYNLLRLDNLGCWRGSRV